MKSFSKALAGLLADILLAAVFLNGFAFMHHGRAYLNGELKVSLADAIRLQETASAPFPDGHASGFGTHADKFTDGSVIETDHSYQSANVNISWTRHEDDMAGNSVVYYIADIYLRSIDYMRTAISEHGYQSVAALAAANDAILAINGDYSLARELGPIVRDGMLFRDNSFGDVLVLYRSGEMKTFSSVEFDMAAEAEKGILDVWSFGPMLLDGEGRSMHEFDTTVAAANPRTAIGYYEPGHYCFVAVDGRGCEGSSGCTMEELSKLFEDLGCAAAYNLDGGQSSVMVWNGGSMTVNSPANGGRPVSDIIYIPKE